MPTLRQVLALTEKRRLTLVVIFLGVIALELIYWRIVRGYIPDQSWVHWPEPPAWVAALYAARWAMRALLAIVGLGLVWFEWQGRSVSTLLTKILANPRPTVLFLLILNSLLATFVFQPSSYIVADNRANVSIPWGVLQLLKQGNWPIIWTTFVHMGSPFLQYHNSLYYYPAALLGLLVPDFFIVSEIMAFLLFVGSALAMFLYVDELAGSKLAAFVATVAWCGSFYRFQQIALGANLPLTTTLAAWPILFYFIERTIKSEGWAQLYNLTWVTLTAGAQIWAHVLQGGWLIPLGLLYSVVRITFQTATPTFKKFKQFGALVLAHLGGVLIGSYLLAPLAFESNLVPATTPRVAGLGLEDILDFRRVWEGGYLSYSILLLACLGLILIIAFKYRPAYAITFQAVTLFAVIFGPHYAPWINDILAVVPLGKFVYARGASRYLMVFFGPVATLAGISVQLLVNWAQNWAPLTQWRLKCGLMWPVQIALVAASLILAENIPLTLIVNYKSPDSYLIDTTGRWPLIATLAATPDKTARVLDVSEGVGPSLLYPMLTGHPSLSGNYEEAPDSFKTSTRLLQLLQADLKNGAVSTQTKDLLYQLNIGYLITDGTNLDLKDLERVQRSDSATLWRVPNHSPVIATQSPTANGEVTVQLPSGGDVPVTDLQVTETAATVALQFSLPQSAFVQLSYSAYPYQQVRMDGQVMPTTETPLGFIGINAGPGPHSVMIEPELSPWRKVTLPLSYASFALTVVIALWAYWKK